MTNLQAIKSYFGEVKPAELKALAPNEVKELGELAKWGLAKDVRDNYARLGDHSKTLEGCYPL